MKRIPIIAALSCALLIVCAAHADNVEYYEEIVVTADLRSQTVNEIPTSVSVVTAQEAEALGAQHIEEVLALVPNLNYASGTSRARYFQIRGIGERSQFVDPLNPSVGFLVDNFDFSGVGGIGTLFDAQQVEVLRGPQGTRYGANGLAGLINIKSREPTEEFDGLVRLTAGDYGLSGAGVVLSGPLADNLLGRMALEQMSSDGYVVNEHLGREDSNNKEETTFRAKINLLASEEAVVKLSYFHADINNGYDAFSLDNDRRTRSDRPGHDRQDSDALGIDGTWVWGDFGLQVIGSLSQSDIEYGYDEDWTFDGFHPFGYSSTDNYLRNRATQSLEVRLRNNALVGMGWVAGIYSRHNEEKLTRQYTFAPSEYRNVYDFDTFAAFAEGEVHLTDRTSLVIGGRFERRDTSFSDSNEVNFSPDETLWGGRIALTFAPGDSLETYVSLARGYKAGGFNTDGTLDADLREFDSEDLIELEFGIKGRNGALGYQVAAFFDERRDQQVKSSIVRVRPDGSSEFIDFNGNAAEGSNKGIEITMEWRLNENLEFFAALGVLDATFDDFVNEFGDDLSGRAQAHAPNYTGNFGARLNAGGWVFQFDASLKDEYYFSDRHSVDQNSDYTLINASASWEHGDLGVRFWGRNLGDENYAVRAFGSFGNDPRKNYVTEPYFQWGEPRMLGATITYAM